MIYINEPKYIKSILSPSIRNNQMMVLAMPHEVDKERAR